MEMDNINQLKTANFRTKANRIVTNMFNAKTQLPTEKLKTAN